MIQATACQLLELFNASRLNADAWTTAIELGFAAKLPTRRGCRGGVQKQRTIQPVFGHWPPTPQAIPNKQTGVDSSNLVQLITLVSAFDSCTAATLGLLNVRSLHNKADFITDYARENNIDILCLTETWLTDNDASLIFAIVPHGYKFQHLPRNDRRGGGSVQSFISPCTIQTVARRIFRMSRSPATRIEHCSSITHFCGVPVTIIWSQV